MKAQARRTSTAAWRFLAVLGGAVVVTGALAAAARGQRAQHNLSNEQYIAELDKTLDALRGELQGKPRRPLVFSVNLFYAHGGMIKHFPAETLLKCVDAFHEAGARRADINPAVDPWRDHDSETIKKYDAVVAHIRALGMQLAINPEAAHKHAETETFESWRTAALAAYGQMAEHYQPEVFAVVHEPTTMTGRILPQAVRHDTRGYLHGLTAAVSPEKWGSFAAEAARVVKAASPKTRCAAGVLPYERAFFQAFLAVKDLDAISFDIYSIERSRDFDAMFAEARKAAKGVYIEECWRETYSDPMFAKFKEITVRPGGSTVFADLDSRWLETLSQYASVRGMEAMTVCGVSSMQTLFYYSHDSHAANLDPAYIHRAAEAVNHGERSKTFATLKRLTAQYAK